MLLQKQPEILKLIVMKYYKNINQRKIQAGIEFYKMLFEDENNKGKGTSKDLQHKEETSKENN